MYDYRKMTPEQKLGAVEYRRLHEHPLHSPPHLDFVGQRQFFITGTCFEHKHHIGLSPERMTNFEADLLSACEKFATSTYAWCVLPNHYHVLVRTDDIEALRHEIGLLHGRSSYYWNGEENQRGRQIWFNCFDRVIKSHRHFWASVNYIPTGFYPDDHASTELRIESANLVFVLVLELDDYELSSFNFQIANGLLPCMKVNAKVYCVHSASFQSPVKELRRVYHSPGRRLLHNIKL